MVFGEPKQFFLITKIGTQVLANACCVVVLQAIVESLVVTEIETELLKLPLCIPIGLGDKQERGKSPFGS